MPTIPIEDEEAGIKNFKQDGVFIVVMVSYLSLSVTFCLWESCGFLSAEAISTCQTIIDHIDRRESAWALCACGSHLDRLSDIIPTPQQWFFTYVQPCPDKNDSQDWYIV